MMAQSLARDSLRLMHPRHYTLEAQKIRRGHEANLPRELQRLELLFLAQDLLWPLILLHLHNEKHVYNKV